ncbi:MAG: DUF6438 domain-containing protein [Pseudomonadota bacterium]|nr:DUF6438 domain-containing protein [Pseudomonadota bacterium]
MRISTLVTAVPLLVVIFVSACTLPVSPLQAPAKTKLLAKIERSGCPGACPVFSLAIFFDRSALYQGGAHTVVSGEKEFFLTKDQLSRVRSAYTRKGFLIMNGQCCECIGVSGAPSTRIIYQGNGPYKSINRYHGCLNGWSRNLGNLEAEILEITGVSAWVGEN